MTQADFILYNETNRTFYLTYEHYPPMEIDSNIIVQPKNHVYLNTAVAESTVHPFPTAALTYLYLFYDTLDTRTLIYRQDPINNLLWERENINAFSTRYILHIHEEDLLF
jgi:hypothetical protein